MPPATIPLLRKRGSWSEIALNTSNTPGTLRGDRDGEQGIACRASIRGADDVPLLAVPVLNQCLIRASIEVLSNSPDVISGRGRYSVKQIAVRAWIGAGDDLPLLTVPVFY